MNNKFKTFLVGGAVRDELMSQKPKDLDFVVLAPSFSAMKEQLVSDGGAKIFIEKPEFLTIRCNHPKFGIADFAVARLDGDYKDGRRPETTGIASGIEADLSRRDFTIGAIAKDMENGALIDPHGGQKDIQDKVIRCVGNPIVRFNEDKLRVFRALRFALTKKFRIEQETNAAIHKFAAEDFGGVSTERIRDELFKMFAADSHAAFTALFVTFPLLGELVLSRGIWFEPTTRKA